MVIARKYRYVSLTAAIDDKNSPLRRYLDQTFPNRSVLQAAYRATRPPLFVPGGTAHPATLGSAFDLAVRFVLDPNHRPEVALHAFRSSFRRTKAIVGVIDVAQAASNCRTSLASVQLLRAAWALALTTGISRGDPPHSSPLRALGWRKFTTRNLLDLAPANALVQMQQMHAVSTTNFYPFLPNPARRLSIGPTFAGSRLCSADADLIINGHLIDLKTRLGAPNSRTGVRADSLPGKDINQLLGYTLFDRSNNYRIKRVGTYSARYGNFVSWPLTEFLRELSGRDVDVAAEREKVWKLLGG
jgi:hypothetical protein